MPKSGISALLGRRWTPLLALLLGSLSFVGLVLIVVPSSTESLAARSPAPTSELEKRRSVTVPATPSNAASDGAREALARPVSTPRALPPRPGSSAPEEAPTEAADLAPEPPPLPPPVPVSTITGNADDYPIGPKND